MTSTNSGSDYLSVNQKGLSIIFGVLVIAFGLRPCKSEAQWIRATLPDSGAVATRLTVLGNKLFVGTENDGLFYTTDDGSTWESPDSTFLDSGRVWFLSVVGTQLFTQVGNLANFISSSDSGRSWQIRYIPFADDWFGLVQHGTQWFTVVSNSIIVLNDSGKSWKTYSSYFYSKQLNVLSLAFNDSETFVGTSNGIYVSADSGQTWQLSNYNYPIYNVVSISVVGSTILASTQYSGVYRADLYPQSRTRNPWAKSDSGITNPYVVNIIEAGNGLALLTYNEYPFSSDVFFSTDAGISWEDISFALVDTGVSCIAASDSDLYVGTYGGTVYRRPLSGLLTAVKPIPQVRRSTFSLFQNYPNPFNPTTAIGYQLSAISYVTLKVYDVLGRLVRTLVNKVEQPGSYSITFNASGLASGVYFYRIDAGDYSQTHKLMVLK